jgi:hypothetical protein
MSVPMIMDWNFNQTTPHRNTPGWWAKSLALCWITEAMAVGSHFSGRCDDEAPPFQLAG